MKYSELKVGLQLISKHGDVFEVCALSNNDQTVLLKLVEAEPYSSYTPVDLNGEEITNTRSGWVNKIYNKCYSGGRYEVHFSDLKLWYEDVPNFTEGDIVEDRFGNKYEVTGKVDRSTDDTNFMTYCVKLIEFSGDFVQLNAGGSWTFDEKGDEFFIYNTQNEAVLSNDYTGSFQLFASELQLAELVELEEDNATKATSKIMKPLKPLKPMKPARTARTVKPSKPAKPSRPSITEIREITAKAENADLDKVLDVIYPKILEAAERGEHTISFDMKESEMRELAMFSPKYKIFEYFSNEGYTVLEHGGEFEIKW